MTSRASVVVPVWNNRSMTLDCLASLRRASSRTPFRIVVVDNGSTDGIESDLRDMDAAGTLRLVRNEENLGYARATNQGIAAGSDTEFQLLLNNDTVAMDGWLDALVDDLDAHPEADVAGSLLLYPGGETIQHAGLVAGRSRGELKFVHRWQYRCLSRTGEAMHSGAVDAVTGASMLVRTSAFVRFGALSEEYRNGFEDIDFCARLTEAERTIRYVADSRLLHLESRTPGRRAHEKANASLFRSRWGNMRTGFPPREFAAILEEVRLRRRLESDPTHARTLARLAHIVRGRHDGEAEELDSKFDGSDAGAVARFCTRLAARF